MFANTGEQGSAFYFVGRGAMFVSEFFEVGRVCLVLSQ